MQIIDELECAKRGPYGGGIGHVSFTGGMDMALALRTMVIPTAATDTLYDYGVDKSRREWVIHVQAGAGLVADSVRGPWRACVFSVYTPLHAKLSMLAPWHAHLSACSWQYPTFSVCLHVERQEMQTL